MKVVKQHVCHGGQVQFIEHVSQATSTPMTFSLFLPPQATSGVKLPTLFWLSGLTCSAENFTTKAHYQQLAAQLGLIVVAPDTSPRGANVPGEDESYDLGTGAGFYVNATVEPWSKNYRMYEYVVEELPALVAAHFPVAKERCGVSGHSMGGHGALVVGLRNPDKFKSISAFAPICHPTQSPWGQKAFQTYLGDDQSAWAPYDAVQLLGSSGFEGKILVDQGGDDEFLESQLMPDRLEKAAAEANVPLILRRQPGYDHSYYFIQTFLGDHLKFHAEIL